MARLEGGLAGTRALTVGFYFGDRYQPEHIRRTFAAIRPLLKTGGVRCFSSNLPATQATFARASEVARWSGTATLMDPDSREFETFLRGNFVERIEALHKLTNREVTLRPWVDTDDTVVYEVLVSLYDREERSTISKIVEATWKEGPLSQMLDRADPLWASFEVAGPAPTLGTVRKGEAGLPYCGYWGSKLVRLAQRQQLLDVLQQCPKILECPSGGILLCWDWSDAKALEMESFAGFRALSSKTVELLPQP